MKPWRWIGRITSSNCPQTQNKIARLDADGFEPPVAFANERVNTQIMCVDFSGACHGIRINAQTCLNSMSHNVKDNAANAIFINSSQPQVEMNHRQLWEGNTSRGIDSNTQIMMSSFGINTTQTNLTGSNTLDKFIGNLAKAASQQHSTAIDIQNFATQKNS